MAMAMRSTRLAARRPRTICCMWNCIDYVQRVDLDSDNSLGLQLTTVIELIKQNVYDKTRQNIY